jgi:hypothetical protein
MGVGFWDNLGARAKSAKRGAKKVSSRKKSSIRKKGHSKKKTHRGRKSAKNARR